MARKALKFDKVSPILPAGGFADAEASGRIKGAEVISLSEVVEDDAFRSLRLNMRDVDELAEKIKERGQLVPVLVWLRRGRYVLLSGHRRVAALRLLGESIVKAIVYSERDLTEEDALDIAITDNVDRDSFSKLELAALVLRLAEQGRNHRDIARKLRISTGYVSYYNRLSALPDDVRSAVDEEILSVPAGIRLEETNEATRARVIEAARESGPLSAGDVERLLDSSETRIRRTAPVAKRGAAWSRESSIHAGLVWQRQRGNDRQFRIVMPSNPTQDERGALREFLKAQLEALE